MKERYSVGWTDARSIWGTYIGTPTKTYGTVYRYKTKWGAPLMEKVKIDDHKYETEAKDLPIEACVNMWIIKYGDGIVPAVETAEQDKLMWEIGNRLWWANGLKYEKVQDTYEIII